MSIFDDMLAPIYDLVADTTVTRSDGTTFAAVLDSPDVEAFDLVAGQHTLRAARSVGLVEGERLVIGAVSYRIQSPPRAIRDGREIVVTLGADAP